MMVLTINHCYYWYYYYFSRMHKSHLTHTGPDSRAKSPGWVSRVHWPWRKLPGSSDCSADPPGEDNIRLCLYGVTLHTLSGQPSPGGDTVRDTGSVFSDCCDTALYGSLFPVSLTKIRTDSLSKALLRKMTQQSSYKYFPFHRPVFGVCLCCRWSISVWPATLSLFDRDWAGFDHKQDIWDDDAQYSGIMHGCNSTQRVKSIHLRYTPYKIYIGLQLCTWTLI